MLHDLPLQDTLVGVTNLLLRLLLGVYHLLGNNFASLILLSFLMGVHFSLPCRRSCEVIHVLCIDLVLAVKSLFLGIVVSLRIGIEGVVLGVILNVDAWSKIVLSLIRNDECIDISVLNQFAVF